MHDQTPVVLIVDDDRAVREALQFALRLEGFGVRVFAGGAALLAEASLPEATMCLVVDEKMPGMDGFELLKLLRARHVALPAILITSHTSPRLRARAAAAGVQVVLEKPLLDNVLAESIRAIQQRKPG